MTKSAAVMVIGDDPVGPHPGHQHGQYRPFPDRKPGEGPEGSTGGGRCQFLQIVAALNALRAAYDFVFTTGGIGPTHDDITADAVAKAFNVTIGYHPDAYALLEARYPPGEFNDMRKRMARIPHGAALVANSVSGAPGFHIGNVFVHGRGCRW